MGASNRKRALDAEQLAKLPYLTTSQVAFLFGGTANSTVRRSGLKPSGKRGRSYVYEREAVMRALAGSPVDAANTATPTPSSVTPTRRSSSSTSNADALERIRAIAKGG